MAVYVTRRMAAMVVTMLLVSAIAFVVIRVVPGDPAQLVAGTEGDAATVQGIRHAMGLDRPLPVQFVTWLSQAVRGNFGLSLRYQQPVFSLIMARLPLTLGLTLFAMLLAAAIALPLGVVAALHRNRLGDAIATALIQLGIGIPSFWFGILLILLFAVTWHALPSNGFTPWSQSPVRAVEGLVLPAVALALPRAAVLTRQVRSSLLEVLNLDFVRTARAKGLAEGVVIYRHALKNALIPPLTVLGLQLGELLAGSIVVEMVFSLPGMGQLIVGSIASRDLPVVQGAVAFVAFVVVFVNFVVDLAYTLLDPRIRY